MPWWTTIYWQSESNCTLGYLKSSCSRLDKKILDSVLWYELNIRRIKQKGIQWNLDILYTWSPCYVFYFVKVLLFIVGLKYKILQFRIHLPILENHIMVNGELLDWSTKNLFINQIDPEIFFHHKNELGEFFTYKIWIS